MASAREGSRLEPRPEIASKPDAGGTVWRKSGHPRFPARSAAGKPRPLPEVREPPAVKSKSDEQLMAAVKCGDIAAFELLVERYKEVVFGLARSMLRSREDAEEAAQDTFIKLFRAREQFDDERRLEPWLLRIAGNTCRDALRRRRTEQLPITHDDEGDSLARMIADPRSVSREWNELTRQAVRQALDRLSDKLRMPLVLKYANGLTNQQIADALGISLSNVKVRMARAKDLLQVRLGERMET